MMPMCWGHHIFETPSPPLANPSLSSLPYQQAICAFAGAAADPAPLRRVVEDPVLLKEWLDLRPQPQAMKARIVFALFW